MFALQNKKQKLLPILQQIKIDNDSNKRIMSELIRNKNDGKKNHRKPNYF